MVRVRAGDGVDWRVLELRMVRFLGLDLVGFVVKMGCFLVKNARLFSVVFIIYFPVSV